MYVFNFKTDTRPLLCLFTHEISSLIKIRLESVYASDEQMFLTYRILLFYLNQDQSTPKNNNIYMVFIYEGNNLILIREK